MSTFRELVSSVREQWEAAVAEASGERPAPPRPTSLREAGATGSPEAERARLRQARDERYPEGRVPNDQEAQPRRRPPVQPVARAATSGSGDALRAALRSPASLRTAILVREVLDPPLALRGERQAPGE